MGMYLSYLKTIALLLSILGTCILAAWFIMKPDIQAEQGEVVAPPEISATPIAFISPDTGESVFVTFGTSTALLNGLGYNNLLLTQVESASGAKYESTDENLILWNKETEVTVTRGRKTLFVGQSEGAYVAPGGTEASSTTTVATSSEALSGTWLWVETVKDDKTIIPKKPGVFSITFVDGTISGTTDCNGFSGQYTKEGDSLTIGALATTKMFCEGSQEMEFTQQFIGSLTAAQSGTTLTLTHSDGTVSRFEKK
jgi:heat shock protein HslJ